MDYQQAPPFAIQIEPTEGCTLRCNFCGLNGIRGKKREYKFLTMELAWQLAAQIRQAGWNPRIEFAMHGEPTLNPELPEIVQAFRQALPKASLMLTSNGAGISGSGDPVAKLVALYAMGLNVVALDEYEGCDNVGRIRKAIAVHEAHHVHSLPWLPWEYPDEADGNPHRRRSPNDHDLVFIQDISVAVHGVHATLNNHCGCGAPKNDDAAGERCAKPFRELSVRWDGEVAICCNDWRGLVRAGSVQDEGLEATWNGPVMQAARRLLYHGKRVVPPCKGCDARTYRNGLLPDKHGQVELPEPTAADIRTLTAGRPTAGYMTLPVLREWEGT